MQLEVKIDSECHEPRVILLTDSMTEEVNDIVRRLSEQPASLLTGFREDMCEVLEQGDIIRVYARSGKVFAVTERGEFTLRQRLYELEERLDRSRFVRISNSEIVNVRKVRGFDLSLAGTICVALANGETTYASRRYVSKIKQILGL